MKIIQNDACDITFVVSIKRFDYKIFLMQISHAMSDKDCKYIIFNHFR